MKRRKLTPLPRLKKKLWKLFSEYIRRRDSDENGIVTCISCPSKVHWKLVDCGHYEKRGFLGTCFEERNNHGQCKRCNHYLSGNQSAYAVALIKKYGENILTELDSKKRLPTKYSRSDYEEMIEKYRQKIKALEGFVFGAR